MNLEVIVACDPATDACPDTRLSEKKPCENGCGTEIWAPITKALPRNSKAMCNTCAINLAQESSGDPGVLSGLLGSGFMGKVDGEEGGNWTYELAPLHVKVTLENVDNGVRMRLYLGEGDNDPAEQILESRDRALLAFGGIVRKVEDELQEVIQKRLKREVTLDRLTDVLAARLDQRMAEAK